MYIKNIYASTIFKGIYIILCALALGLDFGIGSGHFYSYKLNYYTVLSNIACLIFFLLAFKGSVGALTRGEKGFVYTPRGKGFIVFGITVTMLIYHFMLAPDDISAADVNFFSLENMLLHYVCPAMVILDWLLFDSKGCYHRFDPVLWLIPPFVYMGYALVRAQFADAIGYTDSAYPYDFLDVETLGWGGMLSGVGELVLIFLAIGYFYYIADWLLAGRKIQTKSKKI
jgi:hypothetical protein